MADVIGCTVLALVILIPVIGAWLHRGRYGDEAGD
jgi:hypothetical protein